MRVIAEIPHELFKITVYSWNEKYLVKFERGMYEQTYKIREMDLTGEEEIHQLISDQDFINTVSIRFDDMHRSLGEGLSKLNY